MSRKRNNVLVLLGAAVAALLILTACSFAGGQESANTPAASQEQAAAEENEGNLPLDFELSTYQGQEVLGGEMIQFSELLEQQDKPIVLNFWAGLCPPCRVEMPDLQMAYNQYNDQILLVGLDVGTFTGLGTKEEGLALLQELEVTYPTGTTAKAEVMQAYDVVGMPSTVFIAPDGEIVNTWTGLLNEEKMGELVEELIAVSNGAEEG